MKQAVDFQVEGMRCDSCARKLRDALAALPGVQELSVSIEERRARVVFETSEIHINDLATAIGNAGFKTLSGCP